MKFYQVKAQVTNAVWSTRATQPRPQVPRHRQTRYERMLLNTFNIPPFFNVMAAVATWLTLAGYVIFPGTFTSLQSSQAVRNAAGMVGGEAALKAVQNIGLLWLAAICCVLGLSMITWLWWRWYENYIWLIQHLFTPTAVNAFTGFVTTLVSVYTARGGAWSVTAIVTASITATFTVCATVVLVVYNHWLLAEVQREHSEIIAEGANSSSPRIAKPV